MSRLEFYNRPLVAFDPYNKDHRRYYAEYLEVDGWGRCPVRFICPEDSGSDLPSMIKNSLIQYYVDREFGGGKMSQARAQAMCKEAEHLARQAEQLRGTAQQLTKPGRT
jgi:hypothetical protein